MVEGGQLGPVGIGELAQMCVRRLSRAAAPRWKSFGRLVVRQEFMTVPRVASIPTRTLAASSTLIWPAPRWTETRTKPNSGIGAVKKRRVRASPLGGRSTWRRGHERSVLSSPRQPTR